MKNLTKKIFLIGFTGIIIIVFGAWGMGDFLSGKKNIVAEVGKEKIYIQDYINEAKIYIQKTQKSSLKDNDHYVILNTLISQKVYESYAKDQGLIINDEALAYYLRSNDEFKDDNGKFSRIKYEKYLLEKNINAATLEYFLKKDLIKNISFKTYLSGITAPKYHTQKLKNNFLKSVEASFYEINHKNSIDESKIISFFEKNKSLFALGELRNGSLVELSPINLGYKNENDDYYQTINEIENSIINNIEYKEVINKFGLKPSLIEKINIKGLNANRENSNQNKYAKSLFSLNKEIKTDIFDLDNKKFLINLKNIENNNDVILNNKIKSEIKLMIEKEENLKIANNLNNKIKINKNEFLNYAMNRKTNVQNMIFKNVADNKKIFNPNNMGQIFKAKLNESLVLTERKKVFVLKIKKFGKNENKIENIENILKDQVKQEFKTMIIRDFDAYLLKKYPVLINDQALKEVKKSI